MKSKKNKIRTVKIRSDKTIKKISERYKRSVESGKEKASKDLDKLLKDLSEFYGKRGGLLKSKTRSNKQKNRYNELLKEIEKLSSKGKRAAKTKEQQTVETGEKLANALGMSGKHAAEAADIFVNYTMPVIPGFSTSEAVLAMADAGLDSNSIKNILDYLNKEVNYRTPDEMQIFTTEDDLNMFVSHLTNLYEFDSSIPMQDLIKLSEQMTQYDLNDYDSVIEDYHTEDLDLWDEEDGEDE